MVQLYVDWVWHLVSNITILREVLRLIDVLFPPYITLAHVFHAPEGWQIVNRKLKEYALQYVVEGIAEYEIEGTVYTTRTGDLIVHRPPELHSIRTLPGQSYVCISLVFHFGEAAFPLEHALNGKHDCGNYAGQPAERYLSELVTNYQKPDPGSKLKCQALLLHVFSEIVNRIGSGIAPDYPSKKRNRMILIKNYILSHYDRELDYAELEKIAGITKNHLISTFRQTFGISPGQFLILTRIQKAKELAVKTGLSVGEIANRVGYADVHSFGKAFKKKTGYSLTEFCSSLVAKL